ncbi:hypothetical protein NQ315_017585 [Exocentrus adspersus]|uniref:DDE Tnp4 domain-containing protein n=1 Tax=Exocentrus adspersus TaxID=1586481 RepID=A0AAV8VIQ4_9CUCU|nr:hypothetical protein NQ315_017585 [Exocentrus adspersus]
MGHSNKAIIRREYKLTIKTPINLWMDHLTSQLDANDLLDVIDDTKSPPTPITPDQAEKHQNEMFIPPPRKLPNSDVYHPFTLVADEAFPLKRYIIRPYPGRALDPEKRISNYRLSRVRRVIENTFGILVNRWRLLRNMVSANVENTDIFVRAILCLHNYANKEAENYDNSLYRPPGFLDSEERQGSWRDDVDPLPSVGRLAANRAQQIIYNIKAGSH